MTDAAEERNKPVDAAELGIEEVRLLIEPTPDSQQDEKTVKTPQVPSFDSRDWEIARIAESSLYLMSSRTCSAIIRSSSVGTVQACTFESSVEMRRPPRSLAA